jgi:hypothetical protein
MYPGVDYNKLAQQSAGATGQFTQGIDPDWTALANAYGFIQNPFPAAGTEGQDQMRYLATLKNIMDAQLGGAQGRYAQMSPGNPMASMPFGMRQWFAGASPLFNSIQGRMLMPSNQADMFSGGYQFGGLDTSQSSALMQLLASQRQGGAVGQNTPASTVAPGGSASAAASNQVSGGNTPSQTPPAAQAPATAAAQANTGKTSSQVSGMSGDVGQQGAGPGLPQTAANTDIVRGLMQNDQSNAQPVANIPGVANITNDPNGLLGIIQNLPPERKAMLINVLQALMTQGRGMGS